MKAKPSLAKDFVTYIRKTIATALVDRMYLSIGGSSPPSAPVLRARITRLLSQEAAQVEDSHPRWFVQPSANCRNLGVASAVAHTPCENSKLSHDLDVIVKSLT
jgi:hypothetical protein